MNDPILELVDVTKRYKQGSREINVLSGVSLRLVPGEAVALVAPSGTGKSTMLHIAGLLDRADEGDVLIKGRTMRNATDRVRTLARQRDIGMVYQAHHLLPEFTALENVSLPQRGAGVAAGEAKDRAMDLLAQVGLAERAGHRPAELSGGEAQRVAIARALANEPALLLADEPTGNLDPGTAERIFDLLMELVHKNGLATLMATHNLEMASRMDQTLQLKDGKIAAFVQA